MKIKKIPKTIEGQLKLSKRPTTYLGFPINEGVEKESAAFERQRGIAILIALMIITFMIGFVADIVVSARVANQMSINIEEKAKANYLAKSGENLARFLLLTDWGLDLFMASQMKQEITDGPGDIWGAINGLPIGGGDPKMLEAVKEKFELSEISDSKIVDQMSLLEGQFAIDIKDEDSKININFLTQDSVSKDTVYPMLTALFSCPAEVEFLDRKDLNPTNLAGRIADYIDSDKRVKPGVDYTSEDGPYSDTSPKYGPKNLPLDTIDELKLVSGWDDDLHNVFSPYLTVYPIIKEYYAGMRANELEKLSKVNLNTVSRGFLGCMFEEMSLDCKEDFARKFRKAKEDMENLASGKTIKDSLGDLACYQKRDGVDKSLWFKANSSAFTIKVQGLAGDQVSELTSVMYRIDPGVMKKNKLERAGDLLYWKLK